MTKAELIFYEMTDREIFSRAKTVYEKLGMSEKGLLSYASNDGCCNNSFSGSHK